FPLVDVPKIAFVQAENALAHKRKNSLGNSFQAKRARLNKITGLLASKAVNADGAEKKQDRKEAAPVLEQEISPKPQSQKKYEADISSSANIQKSALLLSNLASGKSRSKKCKQESGDSAGCLKPLKTPISPELIQVEDLTLISQLPSSGINKTIPNVAHVSLEKHGLSLPLDLSSNLDVSALFTGEALRYSKQTNQEKEENQIIRCHLSKAGLDGRVAPVAPGKKKEKEKKERKEKDLKSKQKKKKKKKKKSKQHDLSDMEFLDDSSTESLLLSGDEYNQDFDSTNFEESQDEEDALNEIVRCICEMDEENGFMIQCEECLCWQHSACMGLLEDSIPEQYTCYICRDPPGQRWSAKYLCDKDWLNNGHMCGLNKHHPDLHLWACTGVRKDHDQITVGIERRVLSVPEAVNPSGRTCHSQNHKEPPRLAPKMEETYIRSEHSYQKPSFGHDCKAVFDPTSSSEDDDTSSFEQHQERLLEEKNCLQRSSTEDGLGHQNHSAEGNTVFVFNERKGNEEHVDTRLQWQLNLLTHIENVQNEVTSRMDLIEKEVDVLESWLDFTGELEPPDPLARLPQLKRRIKQLISDMGKVQQIATLCSV
ncbi:hypothetical protein Chor_002630, partial [Crotalus horridus]